MTDTIVCIKQVAEVEDADIVLNDDKTGVLKDDLVMGINEWDSYALEEAIRIKESSGGKVVALSLGDEDCQDILRRALAMGADEVVHIDKNGFEGSDAVGVARGLASVIGKRHFDLLLTGVQGSDDGWGQVGIILAEILDLPFASLVVRLENHEDHLTVYRELESNTQQIVELPLPGVVTIQTGINIPRYVSIMGIRRTRNLPIAGTGAGQLGLMNSEIGTEGSCVESRQLFIPSDEANAEMLEGTLSEVCEKALSIIREKGGTD